MPIECRGRNGWFQLAHASAAHSRSGKVCVSIGSTKPHTNVPPIFLEGPKEEMVGLLRRLLTEAENAE